MKIKVLQGRKIEKQILKREIYGILIEENKIGTIFFKENEEVFKIFFITIGKGELISEEQKRKIYKVVSSRLKINKKIEIITERGAILDSAALIAKKILEAISNKKSFRAVSHNMIKRIKEESNAKGIFIRIKGKLNSKKAKTEMFSYGQKKGAIFFEEEVGTSIKTQGFTPGVVSVSVVLNSKSTKEDTLVRRKKDIKK